ncbi:MAG TPA: EAL domain-containing protein [Methylophilus sp.]|uniref:sensor domain-containing protein n=1 Tax=Methylophilus sp. TaxID=29541 RepID=UPI002C372531|nr:EAL domain-containing protein [Methylophilus sp.]HSH86995.1 EAL domain-containing protein [Methylophilus sp.]
MKNIQHQHIESDQYIQTLIDNFPFMVWLKDENSRILVANTAYANMVGVASSAELIGKTDFDFFPHDLAQEYVDGDQKAMRSTSPSAVTVPIKNSEGEYYWIESYKSAVVVDGQVVGSLGYARDVTENIQKAHEYRSIVENSSNCIAKYNSACQRIFLNNANSAFYEVDCSSLIGKTPSQYPGGDFAIAFEKSIREVFQSGEDQHVAFRLTTSNGKYKIMDTVLTPEFNANHEVKAVIAIGQDMTQSYEHLDRIHNLAYFDSITKLPNRIALLEVLNQCLTQSPQSEASFAFLMLDLDGFKAVNDLLGHAEGDLLLYEMARRIERSVRPTDTVSRLGGDEFAIVLSEVKDPKNAGLVAKKVLESIRQPILIRGTELFISASIGIVICPEHSSLVSDIVKFSDIAMYKAKKQGRNNYQFYSSDLSQTTIERIDIERSLRTALQNDEFLLHYQPQVNLETNNIVGVEALLRWHRNHSEMIPPNRFIGIAEDSGFIIEIGEWIMQTAFKDAVRWNTGREEPITVAINLSSRQFIHNNLLNSIKHLLKKTHCNPAWITLEITESLLLSDSAYIRKTLKILDSMGFRISLDDFGTGYSALSYLSKFPVSEIKIDQSFVQGIADNNDHRLIVQAIISMAKSLGKELVAEGVETAEQAKYLLGCDCKVVQGFYFSKPKPFDEIDMQALRKNL